MGEGRGREEGEEEEEDLEKDEKGWGYICWKDEERGELCSKRN